MNPKFAELKNHLSEIHDLVKIGWILNWDLQTMMSARGGAVRAEQAATIQKVAHEKLTDPALGHLLDDLRGEEAGLPYDSDEASLIRVARRDYEKAVKVPVALRAEITRTAALARQAWMRARQEADFQQFLPHLQKTIDLKHQYVECLADDQTAAAYDVLLDEFEPEMKTAEVQAVFDALKTELIPFIAALRERQDAVSDAPLHGRFPTDRQKTFCWDLIETLGARRESWRLDPTVHPFASNSATQDIRITTRYYEHFINPALFGSMHEFGHGLYEHQVSPSLERTPLCRGASLGLHESQSRLWENLVGRSRPFWQFMYPRLQAAFPEQFAAVDLETFYCAINKVQPSFIRVEADEATYALHIILRFEMEQDMLDGRLALRDVPEAWNARFKQYFGLDVPNDADGVLQDIHWSGGMVGYFPTYALGSIMSAQIWEKVLADLPDLNDQLARGEFAPLRAWLRDRLHQHGRKFSPTETLRRAIGQPAPAGEKLAPAGEKLAPAGEKLAPASDSIDVGPFMRYLKTKFGEIYGLS